MSKSILLAVDSSHYSEVCTRYALEYARMMDSKLTALNVLDHKELAIVYPYYYPTADFPPVFDESILANNELFEKQKKRAVDVLQRIEQECQQMEIPCSTEIRDGIVSDLILNSTQTADLLFVGRRGAGAEFSAGMLGSNLELVIRQADIPIIVTPHSYRALQTILVCFDGSEPSIRALRAAARLADECRPEKLNFNLLVVKDDETLAQDLIEKAGKYLDAYGILAVSVILKGDVVEQIITQASSSDIDLVVMGAYGHSRIRELMIGSTTELVLRKVNRAFLLHH